MAAPVGVMSSWNAAQDFHGGRGRDGESAVGAIDGAVAIVQAAAEDFFHAEILETHAGQDDVGDAVEGTDFVEVDGLRRLAVDFALGHGDAMKNAERPFLDEFREVAVFDQFADFGVGAAFLVVMIVAALAVAVSVLIVIMMMPVLMLVPVSMCLADFGV